MASGVPIEGEAGVGYILREGYEMPPLMFTADEIVSLVAGARMIRAWGGAGMARAAEEALVKIEAVLPDSARARAAAVSVHAITMPEMSEAVRARIDRIETAAQGRLRLEISYADEAGVETRRTIRPLGLWYWGKVWTVVGWCELREGFRMFRLDRIGAMEEGERFRDERGKRLSDFYEADPPPNGTARPPVSRGM